MSKQSELIALVDMDGTLCDFDAAIKDALLKLRAPNEEDDKLFSEKLPHIKARWDLIKSQPGFWRNLKPLESGFRILDILRELEFDIHILTKGPAKSTNAWTEKVEWCQEHVPDASVHITQDKGLVYGKVLVDDYPNYIDRWLEWRPRGLVIMPSHDWNKDYKHDNVIKYNGEMDDAVIRSYLEDLKNK